MEKLKPLCTADGNAKWCSHCGIQYGESASGYTPQRTESKASTRYPYTHVHGSIIATTKREKQPKCPSTMNR